MKLSFPLLIIILGCGNASVPIQKVSNLKSSTPRSSIVVKKTEVGSWAHFLQNLPVVDSPVIDYRGKKVRQQYKHVGVIPYDIGKADLQQCADALMRLRAEYLFSKKRYNEIGFHFTGGQYYSWDDYCKGKQPVPHGNDIRFISTNPRDHSHASLRKYLDLVYTYAGTISLAKELKSSTSFEIGTIVIYAGSPGHCSIIIDEATNEEGKKIFRLAEGYTPAQSIYVLRNMNEEEKSPWHELSSGEIETASYTFTSYKLGKFE